MSKKQATIEDILGAISALSLRMDSKFDAVDTRFVAMDARFASIDDRFVAIDAKFVAIDVRFDDIYDKLDDIHQTLNEHSGRFTDVDIKLDRIIQENTIRDQKQHQLAGWTFQIADATKVALKSR